MPEARTKWAVTGVAIAISAVTVLGIWFASSSARVSWLAQMARTTLTEAERRALFDRMMVDVGTFYDAVPEPDVARLGRRHRTTTLAGAEVRTNGAGFRDDEEWLPRDPSRFRIVCLGDSMVFGQGGPVQDRFCDQVEAWYADRGVTVDGRPIETLAAGVPGWTIVQSTTWLRSRLSAVDPDLILVMTMPNDVTDSAGVTGVGTITTAFSPQRRRLGSGVFHNAAGVPFGSPARSAVTTDVGPQARQRWTEAIASLERLIRAQEQRGGGTLLAVMDFDPYFTEIYRERLVRAGIDAPLVLTSFLPSEGHRLDHDPHPNRAGHTVLADHLVHSLHHSGLVDAGEPPPLHPGLTPAPSDPDPKALARHRRRWVAAHVRPRIDFPGLDPALAPALLGGVLPDDDGTVWASVRAGWLLERSEGATEVVLGIEVPDLPELLPLDLELLVNGKTAAMWTFDTENPGSHDLVAPLPAGEPSGAVGEIVLQASSYFTTLDDDRMKSVRLISAEIQ